MIAELDAAAQTLAHAMDRDAAAYEAVRVAHQLPKGTTEEQQRRDAAIQQTTRGAAEVPLQVAEAAVELYERLGQLEAIPDAKYVAATQKRAAALEAQLAASPVTAGH